MCCNATNREEEELESCFGGEKSTEKMSGARKKMVDVAFKAGKELLRIIFFPQILWVLDNGEKKMKMVKNMVAGGGGMMVEGEGPKLQQTNTYLIKKLIFFNKNITNKATSAFR